MKRIVKLLCLAFIMALVLMPARILATDARVVDDASLLSQQEYDALTDALDEISERQQCDVLFHTTHVYYDKDGRMLVQLLARRTEYEDGDYRSLYLYYIDEGYDGAGIPQAARMTGKDLPALGGGWYWWSRREHRG